MLIAVRLFSGAMQANAAVANAYVADISAPEDRARRFGLVGAMFGLGFTLGPVMGGLLGAIDLHLPFFAAGGLAVLNWLYGWFVLPESLPADRRKPFEWRRTNPFSSLKGLARLQGVGSLVAVIGLASLAQFTLHNSFVLYTTFKFGWGPAQNGWALFTVGLMSVLVQGFLLKHLLKRISGRVLAIVGLSASTLTYFSFGAATEGWMMFVIIVVGNILGGGAAAVIQGLVSNAADARSQGQTMGSVAALNSLMAVIAPVVSAPLLGMVSHLPAGDWRIGLPFYFCAGMQLIGTCIAVRHFRHTAPLATAAAVA
jgi:DHA1 family tetracycline resistance protein-like MFS transporter